MSKQVEGLAKEVAIHLTSHPGNEVTCLGIDAVEEILAEVAAPALYKHFSDRLLSEEVIELLYDQLPSLPDTEGDDPPSESDIREIRAAIKAAALQAASIPETNSSEEGS